MGLHEFQPKSHIPVLRVWTQLLWHPGVKTPRPTVTQNPRTPPVVNGDTGDTQPDIGSPTTADRQQPHDSENLNRITDTISKATELDQVPAWPQDLDLPTIHTYTLDFDMREMERLENELDDGKEETDPRLFSIRINFQTGLSSVPSDIDS